MRKAVKFLLLGSAIGGGMVALKAMQSSEPVDDLPMQAAKSAGIGGVVGFVLGLVLDRRSAAKQAKRRRKLAPAVAVTGLAGAAKMTRRKARKAAKAAAKEAARRAKRAKRTAGRAAEVAWGRAEGLVDAGRHKLAS